MNIPFRILDEIEKEHKKAISKFPTFASAHEGLAIIEEEFEELKREVFVNQSHRDWDKITREAIQLATMAVRFLIDVCPNRWVSQAQILRQIEDENSRGDFD